MKLIGKSVRIVHKFDRVVCGGWCNYGPPGTTSQWTTENVGHRGSSVGIRICISNR